MGKKKRRSTRFKNSSKVIDMEQARKQRQEKRHHDRVKQAAAEAQPAAASPRQDRRKLALRRRRQRRNLLIVGVVAILLVLVGVSAGHIFVLKHDLHNAQQEQIKYQEEREQLRKDLKEIGDLDNLEEQARDQMRLIKPGEILYIFPEDMTKQ